MISFKNELLNRMDKADYYLVYAVLFFIISFFLKMIYPNNIIFEGLHFIADAALVGGVADLFAVTAIFKYPCGVRIPNTAILPRKKKVFAIAAASFVKDLLNEDTVMRKIRGINFLEIVSKKLKEDDNKEIIISHLLDLIKERVAKARNINNYQDISDEIRQRLYTYKAKDILRKGMEWLRKDNNGEQSLEWISSLLQKEVSSNKFQQVLSDCYKEIRHDKPSGLTSVLVSALEKTNVININDATETTQAELLTIIIELGTRRSETQNKVLRLIINETDNIVKDRNLINSLEMFRKKIIENLPLEEAVEDVLYRISQDLDNINTKKFSNRVGIALRSHIADVLRKQIILVLDLLHNDSNLHNDLDKFIKEVTGRFSVDVARPKVSKVVKRVLYNMKDEQLNDSVRSKIKEDLMFIRINGVKVGAFIGMIIFVSMQFFKMFL